MVGRVMMGADRVIRAELRHFQRSPEEVLHTFTCFNESPQGAFRIITAGVD